MPGWHFQPWMKPIFPAIPTLAYEVGSISASQCGITHGFSELCGGVVLSWLWNMCLVLSCCTRKNIVSHAKIQVQSRSRQKLGSISPLALLYLHHFVSYSCLVVPRYWLKMSTYLRILQIAPPYRHGIAVAPPHRTTVPSLMRTPFVPHFELPP